MTLRPDASAGTARPVRAHHALHNPIGVDTTSPGVKFASNEPPENPPRKRQPRSAATGHVCAHSPRGGATKFDGTTFTTFTKKDGLNGDNVYCILEDKAGNIWFGSVDAGLCRYDGKTFTNLSNDGC